MATLVFAKEFLDDFAKLEPPVRQKVRELPDKFEHSARTGVHLEKLTGARDDRVRTVRVDQFWRGVVIRLGQARYALLRVLGHNEANELGHTPAVRGEPRHRTRRNPRHTNRRCES